MPLEETAPRQWPLQRYLRLLLSAPHPPYSPIKPAKHPVLTGAFDSLGSFKREGYIADDANLPDNFLTRLQSTASAISKMLPTRKSSLWYG